MLLGAEADGKGAAGDDQGRTGATEPDTERQAEGQGQNKDEVGAERLRFPVEDEAIGKESCNRRRVCCHARKGSFWFDRDGTHGASRA